MGLESFNWYPSGYLVCGLHVHTTFYPDNNNQYCSGAVMIYLEVAL